MKGKWWWIALVVVGALAGTAGFLRPSPGPAGRPGETSGTLPGEPPSVRGVITQVEPASAGSVQGSTGALPPGREAPGGEAPSPAAGDDPDAPVAAPPGSPTTPGTDATGGTTRAAGPWRILVEEDRAAGSSGSSGNSGHDDNRAGGTPSSPPIWLTVDAQTQVGASAGRHFIPLAPGDILQPGQSVRAWVRGGIRESYPAQADAGTVLVEPYLEGVVEERAPAGPGDGAERTRLLVRGRALPPHAAGTGGAVWITLDARTVVAREDGRRAALNDLNAGTGVTVWAAFPMLLSDPPQAYAPLVVVRNGP